ncbi:hypothetical protein CsSME_00045947 [Camellia sinensis var. sinensis]
MEMTNLYAASVGKLEKIISKFNISKGILVEEIQIVITLKMHHGGTFICNPNRLYVVGGRKIVKYFDYCKDDYMSMLYIEDLVEKLDRIGSMSYYYRMPDKDLTSGLVNVRNDNEVMGMLKFLNRNRQIDFYLEHYPKSQPSSILIDDIDELFGGQDEFHRYMDVVEA